MQRNTLARGERSSWALSCSGSAQPQSPSTDNARRAVLLSTHQANKATKTDIEEEYYSEYFNAFLLSAVQGTPLEKWIRRNSWGQNDEHRKTLIRRQDERFAILMLKEAGMCWHKCYRILAGPAKVLQGGLSCPVLCWTGWVVTSLNCSKG